jgi:hypothetical protein
MTNNLLVNHDLTLDKLSERWRLNGVGKGTGLKKLKQVLPILDAFQRSRSVFIVRQRITWSITAISVRLMGIWSTTTPYALSIDTRRFYVGKTKRKPATAVLTGYPRLKSYSRELCKMIPTKDRKLNEPIEWYWLVNNINWNRWKEMRKFAGRNNQHTHSKSDRSDQHRWICLTRKYGGSDQ